MKRGHALIIKKNGEVKQEKIRTPLEKKSCSFERIYFSRGNDEDIYNERIELDYLYIKKMSFFLDVKIFFKTIYVIFTREGAY